MTVRERHQTVSSTLLSVYLKDMLIGLAGQFESSSFSYLVALFLFKKGENKGFINWDRL
ncbi:MAG: hypothetical protein KIH08_00945 [Candidatus Freyarchaeota archaeon]|nr:hypothetical protein [Candidatus Jordarchaeia archaeon]MBS7268121.1 hypothetical protein [Candidatus Jordarchaeia archaeon]MBS7278976.1 hypothetical protein [Candidatus Jordarchaeia archaeon]